MNDKIIEIMRKDLKTGLNKFGKYSFWDKGANEVCDIDQSIDRLRKLSLEEAVATLEAFSKESTESQAYVQCVVGSLDDWEELFAADAPWSNFISCMYNCEDYD